MADRYLSDFRPKWMKDEPQDSILYNEPCALAGLPDPIEEQVGRFGHHPDPEIDACVEIERLHGLLCEAHAGLLRALDYRAATPEGLSIKNDVRDALRRTGVSDDQMGYRSQF